MKVYSLDDLLKLKAPKRVSTGWQIMDTALSGGPCLGTVVLIAGATGSGKSTMLLQMALASPMPILYVSTEEAAKQLTAKVKRFPMLERKLWNGKHFAAEQHVDKVYQACSELKPAILILDSIQEAVSSTYKTSATPASLNLIAHEAMYYARNHNIVIFLVGHMNKDKRMAGPERLAHKVDAVIELNSERIMTVKKNRYGTAPLAFQLEMTAHGVVMDRGDAEEAEVINSTTKLAADIKPPPKGKKGKVLAFPTMDKIDLAPSRGNGGVLSRLVSAVEMRKFKGEKEVGIADLASDISSNTALVGQRVPELVKMGILKYLGGKLEKRRYEINV